MKHGALHNNDCRSCRVMYRITYYISMSISIILTAVLMHNSIRMHQYGFATTCLLIPPIVYVANRITVHIAPQTHGMFLDACGDTSWYRPKHDKRA